MSLSDAYPDWHLCPQNIRDSLERYVQFGVPTGDFLRAVLENKLRESVMLADRYNLQAFLHIVAYCWNKIPSICWGSPEIVSKWIAQRGLEGEYE